MLEVSIDETGTLCLSYVRKRFADVLGLGSEN